MTKKMLVAWDPDNPDSTAARFLYVSEQDTGYALKDIKKHVRSDFGLVVFTGKELAANDLFDRLVDSGKRIPNVDQQVQLFEKYLAEIKTIKVGSIVMASTEHKGTALLTLVASSPSSFKKRETNNAGD